MLNNYLPFNLPLELCEQIFFNLTSEELLKCLLVSLSWNQFITESKCLEKLVLTIDESTELEKVIKSVRAYRNLRLLNIENENFINSIRIMGPLAKKIIVVNCCMKKESEKFNFHFLQELTLSNVSSHTLSSLMSFHENLKILNLHNLKMKRDDLQTVIKLVKINENLTEINLYLSETCNIFQQDVSEVFRCKLVSMTLSFKSNYEFDEETLTNIEQFLISQGKTLKIVSLINAVSLNSLYRVWNYLRNVVRLNFFSADPFFDLDSCRPDLDVNRNLKQLEFHGLGPLQLGIADLQPLLKVTKNLKSLGVWNLNKEIIEYSATNLPDLDQLFCATMESDCKSFYEQLKSKNGINKKIKLRQYL